MMPQMLWKHILAIWSHMIDCRLNRKAASKLFIIVNQLDDKNAQAMSDKL